MFSISNLPLLNVVQYWVNICKDKSKLATHCVANYGTLKYLLKRYTWVQNGYTSFETT